MGNILTRFLQGTDVSIVMFQDSVGKENITPPEVATYVTPFLQAAANACRLVSTPRHTVHLWLDVECYYMDGDTALPTTDFGRIKEQLEVGKGLVSKRVAFDFPDDLGTHPLYGDYLRLIAGEPNGDLGFT